MRIECTRSQRKDGSMGFNWKARIGVSIENINRPFNCRPIMNQIHQLERLTPIFVIFTQWIVKEKGYPEQGSICSINITPDHIDENGNYLAGKILIELKRSYREAYPKAIC